MRRAPRPFSRILGGIVAGSLLIASNPSLAGGYRVSIELPVPPRINTLAVKKILVARFVASEHVSVERP